MTHTFFCRRLLANIDAAAKQWMTCASSRCCAARCVAHLRMRRPRPSRARHRDFATLRLPPAIFPLPLPAAAYKEDRWLSTENDMQRNSGRTQTDWRKRQRKTTRKIEHMARTQHRRSDDPSVPTWPGGVRRGGCSSVGVPCPPGQGRKLTRAAVGRWKRRSGGVEVSSGSLAR